MLPDTLPPGKYMSWDSYVYRYDKLDMEFALRYAVAENVPVQWPYRIGTPSDYIGWSILDVENKQCIEHTLIELAPFDLGLMIQRVEQLNREYWAKKELANETEQSAGNCQTEDHGSGPLHSQDGANQGG